MIQTELQVKLVCKKMCFFDGAVMPGCQIAKIGSETLTVLLLQFKAPENFDCTSFLVVLKIHNFTMSRKIKAWGKNIII